MNIELDPVEAHLVLGAISLEQSAETLRAAKRRGESGEAASIRASVLNRVAERIVDQLMPDPKADEMRWQHRLEEAELGIA